MSYDIIGDVHGQADKLEALLQAMGYRLKSGAYHHPSRTAIFVGDLIDRGPQQIAAYRLARNMMDAGSALVTMGNHEFNAIAWHLPDPDHKSTGQFLRPRHGELGAKNRQQHSAFLAEVEGSALHAEIVDWFLTLPLWLDLPGLRVVHACWDESAMSQIKHLLGEGATLTPELMVRASRTEDLVFHAVETILKGPEVTLPGGTAYRDADGHERRTARLRWWDNGSSSYQDLAMVPKAQRAELPNSPVPQSRVTYDNAKPVFFGHYWMTGEPTLQGRHVACVDYSAGKGGPLVAYRWNGEQQLDVKNFVSTAGHR